jgi:hypothetical protein
MLTTFLCGLALGSLLLARVSDRPRHLLPLLGLLQVGIGIYGLLTIAIPPANATPYTNVSTNVFPDTNSLSGLINQLVWQSEN